MFKLCDKTICKPLSPNLAWRKAFSHLNGKKQMCQFMKKDKHCVNNYRPVSLLPIWSEVLECIIYNTMFTYFTENNLISKNQSGFKSRDSCVNQLLAITCKIFSRFDDSYKVSRYSLTFKSLSIKCDLRELFINLNAMGSQEIYSSF